MLRRRSDDADRRLSWRVASALLRYPDDDLLGALPTLRLAIERSTLSQRDQLLALLDEWAVTDPFELQRHYVEAFDLNKNRALHVSWFQYGDRRQRGMVLLKLKRRYMQFDLIPHEDELPDHLPLMLEFAAAAPDPEGVSLLQEWRAAIELIRRSLDEDGDSYKVVLDLVSSTLPKLGSNVREAVDRLISEGPPGDEVGLEPYGPDHDLTTDLASGLMPSVTHHQPGAAGPLGADSACQGGTR